MCVWRKCVKSIFESANGRDSFQLFVGVFDTCLVWYLLVLPSETHAAANLTSLRAIDGDTSYNSCESFSFCEKNYLSRFGETFIGLPIQAQM